jgi:uncharacterized protein with PIN domain
MRTTEEAYEKRFRRLLSLVTTRHLDRGVRQLVARAERLAAQRGLPLARALEQVYGSVYERVLRILKQRGLAGAPFAEWRDLTAQLDQVAFLCDAGLGGLARWLWAAGYPASWKSNYRDSDLVREAWARGLILLTTDSHLMRRGLVQRGAVRALWIPPSLTKQEQLLYVLRELGLPVRSPRCMRCGGPLRAVDKVAVRERIPPRTYQWLNEYYECSTCGQLFWEGTHWERIHEALAAIAQAAQGQPTSMGETAGP